MRLAMSVGNNNHYRFGEIVGRHFLQTAEKAGMPKTLAREAMNELAIRTEEAIEAIEGELPDDFPTYVHEAVKQALIVRLRSL